MHKNQNPIIPNDPSSSSGAKRRAPAADPNEQWYLSALKLVLPVADSDERRCFPAAPPGRGQRRCLPAAPGQGERGCWP
jgi:hypothetical protein